MPLFVGTVVLKGTDGDTLSRVAALKVHFEPVNLGQSRDVLATLDSSGNVWNLATTAIPAGVYDVTSIATDNAGNIQTSIAQAVRVYAVAI